MTIAVTGASGQLGRLVVDALLAEGQRPVAIVRDPVKVADLAARGVEIRQATYTDPAALDAALTGVDRLLLISGSEVGQRVEQHTNVVRAAERAGVGLLAYTSLGNAAENSMILARDHRDTEAILATATVPTVLLRNNWYWENYAAGAAHAARTGVLIGASGDGRFFPATRADYAAAAAKVLTTEGHAGRVYELGGDTALTGTDLAALIAELADRPVRYENLTEADYAAALRGAGLPEPVAAAVADADARSATGLMDVHTGDLGTLLGTAPTAPREAVRALLN